MAGSSSRVLPVVRWSNSVRSLPGSVWRWRPHRRSLGRKTARRRTVQCSRRPGLARRAHIARHSGTPPERRDRGFDRARCLRWSRPSPARVAAATRERTFDNLPSAELAATGSIPTAAVAHESPLSAAVSSLAVQTVALPAATANAAVTAASPPAAAAQSKATAASAPSAAPGPGSFGAMLRLNLEDLFSGTGKPVVTDPTAVVTGLFQEVLRRDPTATELDNYLNRLKFWGQ